MAADSRYSALDASPAYSTPYVTPNVRAQTITINGEARCLSPAYCGGFSINPATLGALHADQFRCHGHEFTEAATCELLRLGFVLLNRLAFLFVNRSSHGANGRHRPDIRLDYRVILL